VVGNIVFFILLYWFSYRPNNTENRAMDLLSTAQSAETKGHQETALDLYEKIAADYSGTRAFGTAVGKIPTLRKTLSNKRPPPPPDCPARCEDLNLEEMLRKEPTLYIATHMAKQYNSFPSDRAKVRDIIVKNLKASYEWAKIPLDKLRSESEFQTKEFQQAFFNVSPKCEVDPDWIWDNFSIRNDNFFAWSNAVITLKVSQGAVTVEKTVRADQIPARQSIFVLEFRIKKDAGPVTCSISLKSDQGQAVYSQEI
jgi:hypothetical protein